MRKPFLIFCLMASSLVINAQKYTTAAGVRAGSGLGISIQQHLWDKYTAEGIIQKSLFKPGTTITALFEQHNKLLFKGLNFYAGGGPHVGLYNQNNSGNLKNDGTPLYKNAVGITAIGGIEMKLSRLVISYDYQPGINFYGGEQVFSSQTGFTVRYVFLKAKKKEQKWMFWKKWDKQSHAD